MYLLKYKVPWTGDGERAKQPESITHVQSP